LSTDARESPIDLTGQVALVTGGGGDLGRAFALALAGAGARVALAGRTAEPLAATAALVERSGGRALALPGDVTARDAVTRVASTAESQLGPISILVNSAGVVGPLGTTGTPIRKTGGARSKSTSWDPSGAHAKCCPAWLRVGEAEL
jgi:NAD(P)-dependent dehydrogenase (short-subunit alcohol dehydrogenase family)